MEIAFKNRKLERLCTDHKLAQQKLGPKQAKALRARYQVLLAAGDLSQVPSEPPFRRHKWEQDPEERFSVDIAGGCRILFCADRKPAPEDLREITKIVIVFVGDPHKPDRG
ncbi:MAG: hypothetical protein ABIH23_34030 [bacterium]